MLILAGVSISAIVGENGLLTKAQQASFANKIAAYSEEFEMNAVGAITDEGINNRDKITLMNEYVKQYVPSLEDNDIGQFAIINGQLYYVGDEDLEREVCKSQGYNTLPEGMTAEEFASSIENNALEEIIKNLGGDSFKVTNEDGTESEIGVTLYDKNFENSNKWKIITEIEDGITKATYGTGWNYVEKGSNIDGIGILENDYIINYNTHKAVKFDANKHTMLSWKNDGILVKDNLVFSIDSSYIESGKTNYGENVEFIGYNSDLSDAYTDTSFIFNGENHNLIAIKCDSEELNQMKEKGFTFEFYGKIKSSGIGWDVNKSNGKFKDDMKVVNAWGLFGFWDDNRFLGNTPIQMWMYSKEDEAGIISPKSIAWLWGHSDCGSKFKIPGYTYDHEVPISVNFNEDFYISIVTDAEQFVESVYVNGELLDYSGFSESAWNNDVETVQRLVTEIYIGGMKMSQLGDSYQWFFMNSELYSIDFYNAPLSGNQIKANYNNSKTYHNILVNNGNASTGGNTGGEDIGTIE